MPKSLRQTFLIASLVLFVTSASVWAEAIGGRARATGIDCGAVVAAPNPATPVADDALPVAFPVEGGELTIFAAASLTEAFTEVEAALETEHPNLTITYNFGGSPALVTQLSEGAAADAVALASAKQMKAAVDAGVIDGEPRVFTQNRLAIVVPADNPANIQSPADLAKDGVKLVLAGADVPAGQYARDSICKMGADSATYGGSFVEAVGANVVSEEDNVKAVLAKVQLGEADAGIVYTTDITSEVAPDVQLIEIPNAVNVIATYPIAAVKGGHAELAAAFIAYLLGPDGQAILDKHGFEPKR